MTRENAEQSSNREHGFTLVEVLASLVILSILLTGLYNLMIFTNKAAISNNDRLVAINIGKGAMERMQLKPDDYLVDQGPYPKTITANSCKTDTCKSLYEPFINGETYVLTVKAEQNDPTDPKNKNNPRNREAELHLVNVLITVTAKEKKVKSQIEGYVKVLEKTDEK